MYVSETFSTSLNFLAYIFHDCDTALHISRLLPAFFIRQVYMRISGRNSDASPHAGKKTKGTITGNICLITRR